jgi:predicted peptidase
MQSSSTSSDAYPTAPGTYDLTTQTVTGESVQYTLRIPAQYDGHSQLPVILCLHFGGQATSFYGRTFLHLIPVPGLGDLPAFFVAPTMHSRDWTAPEGEAVVWAALQTVEQVLPVDTSRRVVMGYSLGGIGTWHFATAFRDRFMAAIPIASAPRRANPEAIRDLPLYVIHSQADRILPIEDDEAAVKRLRELGAPVQFAALPQGDHFDYRLVITELQQNVADWLTHLWEPNAGSQSEVHWE